MAVVLRFFFSGLVMGAVLLGVTSPGYLFGALFLLALIGAAALHARFSGRPF